MTPDAPVTRRTQAERRDSTRAALADAAIEGLVEQGWAATTAVWVCERAGLTRGAFHHHFDGLPALFAEALARVHDELRRAAGTGPVTSIEDVVDRTWACIGRRRFKAVVEAWLAMANEPELRTEIGPVVASFASLVDPATIAEAVVTTDERRTFVLLAREAMIGLALGRAANGGRALPHEAAVLDRLRGDARRLDRG